MFTFVLLFSILLSSDYTYYTIKSGETISDVLYRFNLKPLYGKGGFIYKTAILNKKLNLDRVKVGTKILLPVRNSEENNRKDLSRKPSLKYYRTSIIEVPESKYEVLSDNLRKRGLKTQLLGVSWDNNKEVLRYKLRVVRDTKNFDDKINEKHETLANNSSNGDNRDKKTKKDILDTNSKRTENKFNYLVGIGAGLRSIFSADSNANNAVLWSIFSPSLNFQLAYKLTSSFYTYLGGDLSYTVYKEPSNTILIQNNALLYNVFLGVGYGLVFLEGGIERFHYIYGNIGTLTVDAFNIPYTKIGISKDFYHLYGGDLSILIAGRLLFPRNQGAFMTKYGFGGAFAVKYTKKFFDNMEGFLSLGFIYDDLRPEITKLSNFRFILSLGLNSLF